MVVMATERNHRAFILERARERGRKIATSYGESMATVCGFSEITTGTSSCFLSKGISSRKIYIWIQVISKDLIELIQNCVSRIKK